MVGEKTGQGKNRGQKREMKNEHKLRLSSCEARGTCDAAGQAGPRPLLLPGPGLSQPLENPSPQGAPDRDQRCQDGKQHSFLELLQPAPFTGPPGQAHPAFSKAGPRGHKGKSPKFRGSQASQGSHVPRLGAAPLQNIHSAHANIPIHTNTQVHTQTHMNIQIEIPALWAGTWGADTTNYHPPL